QVICDDPRVPAGETNLAHKAAIALREATGTGAGVRIEIQKRIPVAGGLGGGSSNAAAALMGLVRLWGFEVAEVELLELGAGLGSDVPLFLIGGTVLGVGRGEEVYPIEQCESRDIALVNPGVEVSTAEAYTRLSRLTMHRGALTMPFALLAAKGIRELPLRVRNDLEDAVLPAHPEIAEVKRRLLSTGARPALMSGSGATVYGVFDNSCDAEAGAGGMPRPRLWGRGRSNDKPPGVPPHVLRVRGGLCPQGKGEYQRGKAAVFETAIRRFESSLPSHKHRVSEAVESE